MSRLKNFSRNLITSYLQLVVNVVYSLVSVPLVLYWLPKTEFGLWAVLVQLIMYLQLVDFGLNQAISRFLVDHKDHQHLGNYGSLLKASIIVSVAQGLIVLAVITFAAPGLTDLMKIPELYRDTFIALLRMNGAVAAFTFFTHPLLIMLNAHQRADIISRQSIFGMIVSLGLLVLFLFLNCGIYSFIYATALVSVVAPCHYYWQCRRLGFLPQAGQWGHVSWHRFKELFIYGKEVFLMNLGIQLVSASQTVVVSCTLGLETAAVWSVGTKFFSLMRQIVYQPVSAAAAGLFEMAARQEHDRLQDRFKNLVVLTTSLGVFLAVAFALCNSLFISLWTSGRIVWSPLNDVLLAMWLFVASVQTNHCNLVLVNKQIGRLPYLLILEGVLFVALSLLGGYRWGLPGILICSVVCLLFFSCQFCLRLSARYFHLSFFTVAIDWLRPTLKFALFLGPIASVLWLATGALPSLWRLVIHSLVAFFVGGLLFFRLGLSRTILEGLQTRLPPVALRWMGRLRLVPSPSQP